MNKKLIYTLNQLKKADKKTNKMFEYLQSLEKEKYDKKLQININRICDIEEILSELRIMIEIELGIDEETKMKEGRINE